MRRRCIWILLSLVATVVVPSYGQTETQQEITVYLKNGKIVQGMTTLSMFEGHLTVEQDEFNQTHIPYADIEQILFGAVPEPEKRRVKTKKPKKELPPFEVQEQGFFSTLELGTLVENSNPYGYYNGFGISLATINGYTFNPHFELGVGVGIDSYGYGNISAAPFFLSVRGFMTRKRMAPFYFFNVGGSVVWINSHDSFFDYEKTDGGWMIQPGLGYRYGTGKVGVSFSIGYKMQQARLAYSWEDWNGTGRVAVDEERTLYRFTMAIGVHF